MRTDDTTRHDDEVGSDLRDAYRRIATETTPPHLDEAVLAAAATAGSPAKKGLWQWRRPLAWATMIGLSFAIVLEFNQTGVDLAPDLEETLPQSAPADVDDETSAEPTGDAALDGASGFSAEPLRKEAADEAARAARQSLERTVATEAEVEKRARDAELETMSAPAAAELRESAEPSVKSLAPATATVATEADALGAVATDSAERLRADADRQANFLLQQSASDEAACDDMTRADPARWRECIRALVDTRRLDEARLESRLFLETFPDEPAPVPVK